MNDPIYIRSPRHIEVSGLNGQSTKLEVFCFKEGQSAPLAPTYTLEKPIPSSILTKCTYNISPFIKKFIDHTEYNDLSTVVQTNMNNYAYCWVKAYLDGVLDDNLSGYTYKYICFDGYGWFDDGNNPTPSLSMMTEGVYNVALGGGAGNLTVFNPDPSLNDMSVKWSHPSGTPNTSVLLPFTVNSMPNVHPSYSSTGCKTEIIQDGSVIATYLFKATCELKYTPINCDFINKHGHWQRLVFFKASKSKLKVESDKFNLNPESVDYSTNKNVETEFNINGRENISVNTGWVDEGLSAAISELMHSKHIRINGVAANLVTKSLELQESINNKNINYPLEFVYSSSTLNYIS